MYSPVSNRLVRNDSSSVKANDIIFLTIMCVISGVLYYCLIESTSMPLVMIAIPLCLYDRSYIFPLLLTIALCQGAFEAAEVTQSSATQDTDFSETLIQDGLMKEGESINDFLVSVVNDPNRKNLYVYD